MDIRETTGATAAASVQAAQVTQPGLSSSQEPANPQPAATQSQPVTDTVSLSTKRGGSAGASGNPVVDANAASNKGASQEPAKAPDAGNAVANSNNVLNYSNDGGGLVMRVVNQQNKEVVRELPPEEQRKMRQMIDKYMAQSQKSDQTSAQPAAASG